MRSLLAFAALALAAAPAAAEPRPAEPRPQPRFEAAIGFVAMAARLDGLPNRNLGATAELAIGRGRRQLFVEGGALAVTVADSVVHGRVGWLGRGAAGVRWVARSLELERLSGELAFEAIAGIQRMWLADGARRTRPELGGGFAWQVRLFPLGLAFRTSVRVLVTPSGAAGPAACRGTCAGGVGAGAGAPDAGVMVVTGVAW